MGGKRLCIRVGWNSVNAHLVTGKGVAQWVSDILRINLDMRVSEGVGWGTQRELFCGIAYTGWNGPNVWFHVAIVRGARMTPTFWAAAMDYPFNQLGVKRISGLIDERNADSRAFATHMGARVEGVLQDAPAPASMPAPSLHPHTRPIFHASTAPFAQSLHPDFAAAQKERR